MWRGSCLPLQAVAESEKDFKHYIVKKKETNPPTWKLCLSPSWQGLAMGGEIWLNSGQVAPPPPNLRLGVPPGGQWGSLEGGTAGRALLGADTAG